MVLSPFRFLFAAAALLAAAPAAAAPIGAPAGPPVDALPGTLWQTEDGKFVIQLTACGAEDMCGDLVWLLRPLDKETGEMKLDKRNPDPALRDRPVCGVRLVDGLEPDGESGRWESGRFYNPDDGNFYGATLRYDPQTDRMILRGYLGIEMLGKNLHLFRVEGPLPGCEARVAAAKADPDYFDD